MKAIAYLISIGFISTLLGCGTTLAPKQTLDSKSSLIVTSPAAPLSSKNQPKISLSEFNQVKEGMTYEHVTEIIGAPGDIVAETGTTGDQFHTSTYNFKGEGNSILNEAFAQLIFQGGKLNTKSQKGLKRLTE